MWAAAALGALLLAAAIGGIAYAVTRGGGDDASASAGVCQVQTVEAQGQGHVERLPADFEPASFPRATGPHNEQTVIYGEYRDPVPQMNLVHNLEHGAVAIQYGPDVPDDVVEQLTNWYRVDPNGIVLAPLPDVDEAEELSDKIAMTAWVAERDPEDDPSAEIEKQEGKLAVCSTFDEGDFEDFLDNYLGRGPELFTRDQMPPGSG
jgi:hypothetical protein